jgi:hypothetical protein
MSLTGLALVIDACAYFDVNIGLQHDSPYPTRAVQLLQASFCVAVQWRALKPRFATSLAGATFTAKLIRDDREAPRIGALPCHFYLS